MLFVLATLYDVLGIPEFFKFLQNPPIIAFRRNRNLQDILGKKTIVNNKNNHVKIFIEWLSEALHLQVKQLMLYTSAINSFKSAVTHKTVKTYNKHNCKSKYLIYQIKYALCNKQYTGKSEVIINAKQPSKRCK